MLKIFIPEVLKNAPYLPILEGHFRESRVSKSFLFNNDVYEDINMEFFDVQKNIDKADYVILPHNYFTVENKKDYIKRLILLSKERGKKILTVAYGDSTKVVRIPNSIVLRTSAYNSELRRNEIIIPAIVEDLGKNNITIRKKSEKPTVGFCGWAQISGFRKIVYAAKNTVRFGPRKQGLYFRRKVISILRSSGDIKLNLIIRHTYSAHKDTISIDPHIARGEYIANIKDSDMVLAPRGDGNYSARFYEALSMGRVPILIDTDIQLPLEGEIGYDKFILRVSYKDLHALNDIIADFWGGLDENRFIDMQMRARKAFETYFKPSRFYREWLPKIIKHAG